MSSTEHLLVSKVIQTGDIQEVLNAGVRPDHFTGEWSDIWSWILEYWREYASVPSARALKHQYGDLRLLNAEAEPFPALIDELYLSYKHDNLVQTVTEVVSTLNRNETEDALKRLSEGLQRATVETAHLRDVDIIRNWQERLERYEQMRNTPNGLRGIPTGFNGLDRITSGLRPQQLITFVGEAKKGKSLMTLIMASAAHTHGVVPMYVSFEMSIEEQETRYDALTAKVSHSRLMRGDLTPKELERLRMSMVLRQHMQPFHFTEDTSSLTTVSALAGKIQQYRPAMLIVDGVYLMDDENGEPKGSPQALTNVTRGLKRLAQRFDIPIVGTTQVLSWKLGNKKTRRVTADSIGYTSSFAQDSDLILSVESDPDIDNQSIIRVILARSAPNGEVFVKWDWEHMDFTEVEDEEGPDDDWYN